MTHVYNNVVILDKNMRWALIFVLQLLLVVLIYLFFIKPKQQRAFSIENQIAALQVKIEEEKLSYLKNKKKVKRWDRLVKKDQILTTRFIEKDRIAALVASINTLALKSQVHIKEVVNQERKIHQNHVASFTFYIESDYATFKVFLERLLRFKSFFIIQSVIIHSHADTNSNGGGRPPHGLIIELQLDFWVSSIEPGLIINEK